MNSSKQKQVIEALKSFYIKLEIDKGIETSSRVHLMMNGMLVNKVLESIQLVIDADDRQLTILFIDRINKLIVNSMQVAACMQKGIAVSTMLQEESLQILEKTYNEEELELANSAINIFLAEINSDPVQEVKEVNEANDILNKFRKG